MSVAQELERIRASIAGACARSGRDADRVRLLAVSKLQPPELIEEAYAAGQRDFGENYVQELLDKKKRLSHLADLRWHFIGHLQTNKAKPVAETANVVHSVDSEKLARALSGRLAELGAPALPIFIQVNIDLEPAKSGIAPDDVAAFAATVRSLPLLELRGLMCIPRVHPYAEMTRPSFQRLAALARDLGDLELSMGMSADLEIAIEAGSNWVRVGTRLFGERAKKL